MNGEVGFVCRLTAAARAALNGEEFQMKLLPFENSTTFIRSSGSSELEYKVSASWFEGIREDGATDIFTILPYSYQDKRRLGFVNTTGSTVFVCYNDGRVARYVPQWEFVKSTKSWNVTAREEIVENAPSAPPVFPDNTDQFKSILGEISRFAAHIGFPAFAEYFKKGYDILDGGDIPEEFDRSLIPQLNDNKLRLYLAADISDVFGAAGSWNDSPGAVAAGKKLDEAYEKLSDMLLAQNRLALMYAINSI